VRRPRHLVRVLIAGGLDPAHFTRPDQRPDLAPVAAQDGDRQLTQQAQGALGAKRRCPSPDRIEDNRRPLDSRRAAGD
jgi:hypothetical protein